MTNFGGVMVAELCDAIADFVDKAPAAAAEAARRVSKRLREHLSADEASTHETARIRAERGGEQY